MKKTIQKLFKKTESPRGTGPIKGFVYQPEEEGGLLSGACEGEVVRNDNRRPPWIVVDHALESLIIPKWPGKLWEVEVVDAVNDADLEASGAGQLQPQANYIRAIAVNILKELPLESLFGQYGNHIINILDSIDDIDESKAIELSNACKPEAASLYSKAWNVWIAGGNNESIKPGNDHFHIIAITGTSSDSPINKGLSVICSHIYERAREVTDGAAILVDEEGEVYLEPTWSKVSDVLLHAAMGYGARDLLAPEECKNLTSAWESVFGDFC